MLEKKYMKRADFREYASRTSIFFPWCPGKKKKNEEEPGELGI